MQEVLDGRPPSRSLYHKPPVRPMRGLPLLVTREAAPALSPEAPARASPRSNAMIAQKMRLSPPCLVLTAGPGRRFRLFSPAARHNIDYVTFIADCFGSSEGASMGRFVDISDASVRWVIRDRSPPTPGAYRRHRNNHPS